MTAAKTMSVELLATVTLPSEELDANPEAKVVGGSRVLSNVLEADQTVAVSLGTGRDLIAAGVAKKA